jgi:predicted Zn finger-like uncharacterized protein
MKFECDSCHAQYMIADEKVGKRGVKVKCKKCQHVIIVRPDGKEAAPASSAAPATMQGELPKLEPTAPAVAPKMEPIVEAKRKSEKTGERSSSKSSVKKAGAKEKAAIELPVPTLAAPPPPGLDTLNVPRDDDAGAFAAGGPTDPSTPAMRGNLLDDGLPPDARGAPPPPPTSDDAPETTGPNMNRPAPISMFQDQTQLTQNPMGNLVSEPSGKKLDDRTELGAPSNMTANGGDAGAQGDSNGNGDANGNELQDNGATQVTKTPLRNAAKHAAPDDDVPAPPPAPPMMATAEGAPPMGNPDDALGDQLSGMFNAMFDAAPAGGAAADASGEDDHRGPTRVLDGAAVDALRKQSGLPAGLPSGIKVDNTIRGDDHGLSDEGFVMKPSTGTGSGQPGADDGPPDQVWHVAIDDQDVGPLSLAEVGRHIEGGRVDRESLVWKIGMDDWLPAGDIPAVRALFDKVPMPRIARVDDEPSAKSKGGNGRNLDMGMPGLDDAPPSGGNSPFDESGEESWRPHGLTDVYQAANLAEAAGAGMGGMGGMGGSLGAASFGMSPSTSSSKSSSSSPSGGLGASSSEPEWRPAAASALSALVNDEIKRIDNGPPPAPDDGLSPADDASIDAPIFGSMGGASARGGLDSGPELSDPVAPPRAAGAAFNGAASPSFGGSSSPQGGFISSPPQQRAGMSPALIAGIAGGGALFLVLVILVVVLATRGGKDEPETKIVMVDGKAFLQGPDGKFTPLSGSGSDKDEPKEPKDKDPKDAAVKDPATNPATNPALLAVNTATDPGTKPGDVAAPPADPGTGNATTAALVEKPATDPVKKVAKPPKERDPPPKREDKPPPPKGEDKPARSGDCDPVLDFDCKGGKPAAGGGAPKEPVKDTLSKADVLVVVKANMGKVEGCGRKNKVGGVIKMSWKIQPSGKVSEVSVADSKFAGTPVGGCVTNEIKGWKFPASKAATPVSFPMKLGS